MKVFYCFLFAVVILINGCSEHTDYSRIPDTNLPKTIKCIEDTSQQYVIYLPNNYTKSEKWPVIFAFDPHARGDIPVDSLKLAAEKYGFIIAGSNNAENNLQNVKHTIDILFQDVFSRFSIDKKRIYVAGFSGGGRIASLIALKEQNIKGVISCAAGLPGVDLSQLKTKLNFYGIVGNKDFNYLELIRLKEIQENKYLNAYVEIFDGGHTWPPRKKMEEAVIWFQLTAMKEKNIKKDKSLIAYQYNRLTSSLDSAEDDYHKARICRKAIHFLNGLRETDLFRDTLNHVTNSKSYKDQLKNNNLNLKIEQQLRKQSVSYFKTKDIDWWKKNIDNIRKIINKSEDPERKNTFQRYLNYMSIVGYTFSSKALQAGNLILAEKYLKIYQLADPENPDVYYLKARWFNNKNNAGQAIQSLNKACNLGVDKNLPVRKDFSPAVYSNDSIKKHFNLSE